ncbi:MAG: ABC transporter ATP-binding protein [Lachnospiraceae bacterium]|nr:ABC transporter ATP-binding protein [Lachnospiraceae bacterium]
MLRIRGLKKKFKNFQALNGLDMDVEEGALYGFVGPNGAGKTTAIRVITGLLKPDEGTVEIDGKDAFRFRMEVRDAFGYVPDEFGMYDNLKVGEYMEFFAACYGYTGLVARNRCMQLLRQMKLEDRADAFVDSLSRGMKQRLCLARAMIHEPKLLVLDEPTSGMDPRTRLEFKEVLKELCAEGKTILISSHMLSELSQMCTDIGIIDAGRIVLAGSMSEILQKVNDSNPLHIRVLEGRAQALSFLQGDSRVKTISIQQEDITIQFHGNSRDEAGLLEGLLAAGARVNAFMREQGDLESIFMQITNHDMEKVVMRGEE